MAEAEDFRPVQSKRKAITALLPYAILQERDGRPEMLITILHAARTSRMLSFLWHYHRRYIGTSLSDASPGAIVLVSPHVHWHMLMDGEGLVQQWVAAASAVAYTEEVGQSVVNALLQTASVDELVQYIPVDLWSWLTKRPSLPPICQGRYLGTRGSIVEVVRALKDIEVLKSYLLLVWSEWDPLYGDGFDKMCTSIREDFGRNGMGHHRVDLIQRLDHVLGQLCRGLEYLTRHNPDLSERALRLREDRYGELRRALLEVNTEAISRTSHLTISPLCILTPALGTHT